MLRPRLVGISEKVTWVTPDTVQSRDLLADEEHIDIPKAMPHDVRATVTTTGRALSVLRQRRWDQVVSTGPLPAVPFMALARAMGLACHFIESAARVTGPSLTARILERIPGIFRYGQYQWGRENWEYRGSVFDGFVPTALPEGRVRKIVVTVGVNGYGFPRLLDAVKRVAPSGADILWQTGATDVSELEIDAVPSMPTEELFIAMQEADVVVAHAGVGSALMAMRAGKCPVLVPREHSQGEHIDNHQDDVALLLSRAGLAVRCSPPELDAAILDTAAQRQVVRNTRATPFVLSTN